MRPRTWKLGELLLVLVIVSQLKKARSEGRGSTFRKPSKNGSHGSAFRRCA
jgi:hypothetical protein